jgi:hypothetical protein
LKDDANDGKVYIKIWAASLLNLKLQETTELYLFIFLQEAFSYIVAVLYMEKSLWALAYVILTLRGRSEMRACGQFKASLKRVQGTQVPHSLLLK